MNEQFFNYQHSNLHQNRWKNFRLNKSFAFEFANVANKISISITNFTSIFANIMLENLFKVWIFEFSHQNLHVKSKKKSIFICLFVSFVSQKSFISFATSRNQTFYFATIFKSMSSIRLNFSIALHEISSKRAKIATMLITRNFTSKRVEFAVFNCSFTFSTSLSRAFVSKSYFIIDDLIRMFREKSRSFDLRQYEKDFAFSQRFDIRSSRQSRSSYQSRIIVYFLFAINQKTSISQNLKSSNSKSFQQHTFAKFIRSVSDLSEKSIKLLYKLLDVFCISLKSFIEISFFIFIFLRFLSIFFLAFAFVSIIFATRMNCISVYQQVISIIDRVNIEFVASKRSWEETRNKLLEYSVTKHQKTRIFEILHWKSHSKSRRNQQTFARLFRQSLLQHLHRYLNRVRNIFRNCRRFYWTKNNVRCHAMIWVNNKLSKKTLTSTSLATRFSIAY